MNLSHTDATPPLPNSDITAIPTDKTAKKHSAERTQAWIAQLVANMNRMAVDDDFRKAIEKKIF